MRGLWRGLVLGLLALSSPLAAQTADSTAAPDPAPPPAPEARPDAPSVLVAEAAPEADTTRTPRGALTRALLLPGLGQAYNGENAKVPFVVVGLLGTGAFAVVQHDRYLLLRRAFGYQQRVEAGVDLGEFADFEDEWIEAGSLSASTLRARRTAARSNRDIAILVTGLVYAAQALDAYVAAHLQDFDVSDDLSLMVLPGASGAPGLTLRATF